METPSCPDKRHKNSTVVRAGWYALLLLLAARRNGWVDHDRWTAVIRDYLEKRRGHAPEQRRHTNPLTKPNLSPLVRQLGSKKAAPPAVRSPSHTRPRPWRLHPRRSARSDRLRGLCDCGAIARGAFAHGSPTERIASIDCPGQEADATLLTASVGILSTTGSATEVGALTPVAREDGAPWAGLDEDARRLVLVPARGRVVISERGVSEPEAALHCQAENPAMGRHGHAQTPFGRAYRGR